MLFNYLKLWQFIRIPDDTEFQSSEFFNKASMYTCVDIFYKQDILLYKPKYNTCIFYGIGFAHKK